MKICDGCMIALFPHGFKPHGEYFGHFNIQYVTGTCCGCKTVNIPCVDRPDIPSDKFCHIKRSDCPGCQGG